MTRVLSAVAWPYANGPRHIGHVAGFGVPSDVFSRYMRMAGHDVLMVSGTDEHGTPILVTADQQGVSAKDLADKNNAVIVNDLADLGLSYDLFTRTTTGNHYGVVQEMFRTVLANGYMVEQTTQAAISPSTGRTLPDRYIEGTCPICGYGDARGDQCDNCGNQLDATDLINPRSKINGETPSSSTPSTSCSTCPRWPTRWGSGSTSARRAGTWRPNVIKFSQNILKEIRPRAMTRDIDWGIPVPGWEDQPTKRLYVWFDAVIGYLSASIEWARRLGRRRRVARVVERPRGPVLLLHGQGQHRLPLPDLAGRAARLQRPGLARRRAGVVRRAQPAHRGRLRRSTSRWATSSSPPRAATCSTSATSSPATAPTPLRYFICAAGPETSDAAFTWADFVTRNNSELVAGWGNLVNRTATMVAKSFGEIPPLRRPRAGRRGRARRRTRRVRDRRRPARPPPAARRDRRGDAHRRRGEQVPHRHRALQDEGRVAARAPRDRAPRRGRSA